MRKIDTRRARRATRTTSREINESILLNLVREHQPISRAELARRMKITPATVSMLVSELLESGALVEGATGQAARGRKPVMLHIRTHDRYVVAVDVRLSRTTIMLSDFSGRPLAMESFSTQPEPEALVQELAERIPRMLTVNGVKEYEGVGLVVPGMVDRHAGLLLNSPQLGWRDVPLRQALTDALGGVRVMLENAPIACALAHLWLNPRSREGNQNFVYVAISDGVGAGVVV
ncbi:MAG TPA: ROK family transcriptional regulator, partial [Longimicrobiaceae bacterium]|nr:ROK family transcriptional regulator [Longimicrobiaceae bacterium]